MKDFLLFNGLLLLFTQIKFLNKFIINISPIFIVILSVTMIVIFINTCYNILYINDYINFTFLDNNKASFLLLFVGTYISCVMFFITKYIRNLYYNIAPTIGNIGERGFRGMTGNSGKCDPVKCQENICYTKIMNVISSEYNAILQQKNHSVTSSNRHIQNIFLKNKIHKLCNSDQYKTYVAKDGYNKPIKYITKIVTDWIHIIMKYTNGKHFLETSTLNDNDFDFLISNEDKEYSGWKEHGKHGTPSKGSESPFDEIKKYDLWYWGESAASNIKIVYKCDYNIEDKIKKLESNIYNDKTYWRGSVARQAKDINGDYIPFLQKGSSPITIYKPKKQETKEGLFSPLGDVVIIGDIDDHQKKSLDKIKPNNVIHNNYELREQGDPIESTTLITGDTKSPIGFKIKYKSLRTVGVGRNISGYSIWEPLCPDKYISLGDVIDTTPEGTPPAPYMYVCVKKKCIEEVPINEIHEIWNNNDKNEENYIAVDTDEPGSHSTPKPIIKILVNKSSNLENKDNLFVIQRDNETRKLYRLIPSDNKQTCLLGADEIDRNIEGGSKWIPHPTYDTEEYSITKKFM